MKTVPGGVYRGQILLHNAETGTADGTTLYILDVALGALTAVVFGIEGINGETITFEGTVDGSNWYSIYATNLATDTAAATATADGIYRATVLGLTAVRARISTGGSGTVTVKANAVA